MALRPADEYLRQKNLSAYLRPKMPRDLLKLRLTRKMALTYVLLKLVQGLLSLVSIAVVSLLGLTLMSATSSFERYTSLVDANLVAVLPVMTLGVAFMLRFAYGEDSTQTRDLQAIANIPGRPRRQRHPRSVVQANYLALLVLTWMMLYAASYAGLADFSSKTFSGTGQNGASILDWLYFSVSVASTSGESSIHAASGNAELICSIQLISGPILLFWTTILLTQRGGGRPHESR